MQAENRANVRNHLEGESSFVTVEKHIRLLKTGDARSRECSARALGQLMDRRSVPALIEALADESGAVRKNALHALIKMKDPSSIGAITRAVCKSPM